MLICTAQEAIEILPVALLDQNRQLVEALKRRARSLGIGPGWHYLLDWTWILNRLGEVSGKHILDAGAGVGLLQWILAERGAEVLSVDRSSRAELALRFRARYDTRGLRSQDLSPALRVLSQNVTHAPGLMKKAISTIRGTVGLIWTLIPRNTLGRVLIYNQDLQNLCDIRDNSQDFIVAVSALEHNSPGGLAQVIKELMRVLKSGGLLLATLCASWDEDWFHKPSQGWCYTEKTLREIFRFSPGVPSNYVQYDELFTALKNCAELRNDLAEFYFHSGDNGMPWGKWDPQYQPVGICKIKN